jgi:hypothetical protein
VIKLKKYSMNLELPWANNLYSVVEVQKAAQES